MKKIKITSLMKKAIIATAIIFSMLLQVIPSHAATTSNAIRSIAFAVGDSSSVAPPSGFTKIPKDLNAGSGGKYIYLCYSKLGSRVPITGLYLLEGQNAEPPQGYYKSPVDLNKGAGGAYIYLCWTTNPTLGAPITDIYFATGKNALAPTGYTRLGLDLNKGAGGEYIYLCYKR